MFILREYLDDLKTLVNIDSNSYYPEGLSEITNAIEAIARKFNFFVKRHHTSELSGDYLEISNKENADKYDVMLMGHIDTVQPIGFAKEHPYSEDENFAYGPGTADMKSGALCMLYTLKELSKETYDKLAIALIFNCDEEITSKYTRPLTQQLAKKSDYAFVLESPGKRATHTIARKGSGTYKIKFHGTSGHSGYIFDTYTANAVMEMARWAMELYALNDRKNLLSVNVAIANGGKVSNVVPDYAELTINMRVAKKNQYEIFENKLKELAEHPFIEGVSSEVEVIAKNYPMIPVREMDEYLERVRKVFSSIGQDFNLYSIRGGCSDGNIIADMGTRCIDSLGPLASGGHTPNEKVYLDDIEPCIRRMTALIEEIATQKN